MKVLKRQRAVITVMGIALLTVMGGAIHGRLTNRWGVPPDLLELGNRLESMPADVGAWRLQKTQELSPGTLQMLRCVGYIHRTYVHRETGEVVHVAVLLGPAGPIAVHTPEICYSSRGYAIQQSRQRIVLKRTDDITDDLWALTFRRRDLLGDQLRVYYGWTTGTRWVAADRPRFQFSGQPWLYKIQLASYVSASSSAASEDPGRDFLENFLPALQDLLPDAS